MPAPRAPSRQRLRAEHPRILCLKLEERQIATDRQLPACGTHRNVPDIWKHVPARSEGRTAHLQQ
jgi:hypothetical protein